MNSWVVIPLAVAGVFIFLDYVDLAVYADKEIYPYCLFLVIFLLHVGLISVFVGILALYVLEILSGGLVMYIVSVMGGRGVFSVFVSLGSIYYINTYNGIGVHRRIFMFMGFGSYGASRDLPVRSKLIHIPYIEGVEDMEMYLYSIDRERSVVIPVSPDLLKDWVKFVSEGMDSGARILERDCDLCGEWKSETIYFSGNYLGYLNHIGGVPSEGVRDSVSMCRECGGYFLESCKEESDEFDFSTMIASEL